MDCLFYEDYTNTYFNIRPLCKFTFTWITQTNNQAWLGHPVLCDNFDLIYVSVRSARFGDNIPIGTFWFFFLLFDLIGTQIRMQDSIAETIEKKQDTLSFTRNILGNGHITHNE